MSLTLLVLFTLCYLAAGRQRRPMLISALLSAPFGFLSIFFVPTYWNPVRIFQWGAGIEDIIFSFTNGGIVWFMVTLPVRNRISMDIEIKRMLSRYLACSLLGISPGLIPFFLGCDPMHISLVGLTIMCLVLLLLRSDLLPLPLVGAVSFGLLYTVICVVSFALYPDFLHQWNFTALSGYALLGIPVEEIAWSIAFGAAWPLLAAFSFETRIAPLRQTQETKLSTQYLTDTRSV
jgi:hypothetical protein